MMEFDCVVVNEPLGLDTRIFLFFYSFFNVLIYMFLS